MSAGAFVPSSARRRLGALHCQLIGRAEAAAGAGAGESVAKLQEPASFVCPDWSTMAPMTDEQRFFFDLRGWILLPAVLSRAECEMYKAEVIEGGARNCYDGMLQGLMDHPAVAGILTELLSEPPFHGSGTFDDTRGDDGRADYLPFRLENSFIQYRETEEAVTQPGARSDPTTGEHNGTRLGHVVRPPQQANAMRYQVAGGRIFSGLTRVVWELEEVVEGKGGTTVLSGSHKAHFNYGGPDRWRPNISQSPWEGRMQDSMESYSCPAGSVLIFTESLIHASNDWLLPNPRVAIFNCYNSVWAQWHRLNLPVDTAMAMPPRRRSLFRGIWQIGGPADDPRNQQYSLENRVL